MVNTKISFTFPFSQTPPFVFFPLNEFLICWVETFIKLNVQLNPNKIDIYIKAFTNDVIISFLRSGISKIAKQVLSKSLTFRIGN